MKYIAIMSAVSLLFLSSCFEKPAGETTSSEKVVEENTQIETPDTQPEEVNEIEDENTVEQAPQEESQDAPQDETQASDESDLTNDDEESETDDNYEELEDLFEDIGILGKDAE